MEELTLVINSPDEGHFLKSIGWNKEQIKEAVVSITEQYRGLAYTEAQLQEAKADRAKLNAMKNDISARRIQVKNALLEPYNKFEAEVKEVVALIDEPIAMIDEQIVAYEERTKEEKRQTLEKFFAENKGSLPEQITFERIFNPKWLNKSSSLSSCKNDIKKLIEDISADLSAIRSALDERYSVYAEEFYLKREMNLSHALAEANHIQEMDRKAEEERKAKEQAQKEREEAQKRAKEEAEAKKQREVEAQDAREHRNSPQEGVSNVKHEQVTMFDKTGGLKSEISDFMNPPVEKKEEPIRQQSPAEEEKIYKSAFMVRATKAKLMMLRDYMVQNGIEFSKIENH
nr:MAG TPA: Protein of unknown function (DUF1351) [Caudoviricetes sp.]